MSSEEVLSARHQMAQSGTGISLPCECARSAMGTRSNIVAKLEDPWESWFLEVHLFVWIKMQTVQHVRLLDARKVEKESNCVNKWAPICAFSVMKSPLTVARGLEGWVMATCFPQWASGECRDERVGPAFRPLRRLVRAVNLPPTTLSL